MRTFIALELPEPFAQDVAALSRSLQRVVTGRFMARETYHLTLAFMGDVGEADARRAMDALDRACVGRDAIPLSSDGLGTFGKPRDCTLWLGIAAAPELMELAQAARSALTDADIWYDNKPFRPHITLARRARLPRGTVEHLAFPGASQAHHVTLFKSTLSADGAHYKPLYTVELSGVEDL